MRVDKSPPSKWGLAKLHATVICQFRLWFLQPAWLKLKHAFWRAKAGM